MPKYKGKDLYEWDDWETDMNWFQVRWYNLLFSKEKLEHKVRQGISHWVQRKTRGWDDSDTWSLDHSLAKIIAPRLKRFKELNNGFPGTEDMTAEKWDEILDEMIWAFEFVGSEERWDCYDKETWDRVQKALSNFGDYFTALWW